MFCFYLLLLDISVNNIDVFKEYFKILVLFVNNTLQINLYE